MRQYSDWMRGAALAAIIAAPALPAAAFAQDDDRGPDPEADANVDFDPETMGEQRGPAGEVGDGTVAAAIRDRIEAGAFDDMLSGVTEDVRLAAEQTYAMRVYDPVWDRAGVDDFIDALDRAPRYGLRIDPSLIDAVREARSALDGRPDEARRAEADLTLSAAFMSYADARVNGAVDPDSLDGVKFEKPSPEPLRRYLGRAGAGEFDHARLDPDSDEFRELREILDVYRRHEEDGGFTTIEREAVVELGEGSPIIPVLRERLAEEGYDVDEANRPTGVFEADRSETPSEARMTPIDPPGSEEDEQDESTEYTEELQAVLEEFQRDNGLKVDGVLGPNTIQALNQPISDKIARIEANMERWRWAPADMPDRHVRVNPPAFQAYGYENGSPAITMEAIVGQGRRPTPMMADEIEYFVANPRWYVPENIFEEDKLDEIREDPDYLRENDFFLLDRDTGEEVPISSVDFSDDSVVENYRLVQGAGPDNALGQIKFMFPNEHAIYLHDTPAGELFDRDNRAFSSGCVRLERPLDMARWIVEENGGDLTFEEVRTAVEGDDRRELDLETPLPVYLFYFSVDEGEEGQPVFHEDIYDRDAPLIAALEREAVTIGDSGGA
ncbi:MAG: L,D-transpeptidase family protein [Oceanicaulis sp.]